MTPPFDDRWRRVGSNIELNSIDSFVNRGINPLVAGQTMVEINRHDLRTWDMVRNSLSPCIDMIADAVKEGCDE